MLEATSYLSDARKVHHCFVMARRFGANLSVPFPALPLHLISQLVSFSDNTGWTYDKAALESSSFMSTGPAGARLGPLKRRGGQTRVFNVAVPVRTGRGCSSIYRELGVDFSKAGAGTVAVAGIVTDPKILSRWSRPVGPRGPSSLLSRQRSGP